MFGGLREVLKTRSERLRNRRFLEATMAACALVADADGEVTFSERMRVDQLMQSLESLQVFDPHEAVDLFNDFLDGLRDGAAGREAALQRVARIKEDPEDVALMMRICAAISQADGTTSAPEVSCIDEIAQRLGVESGIKGD